MNIRKADHVALFIQDVERSRQFYAGILGMREIPRPASFDFPGAWLTTGDFQIHLIGEETEGRARQVVAAYQPAELAIGHCTHVAFEVPDLNIAMQRLRDLGIPIAGGPRPRGDGVQQLYIHDPDGYVVELFAWEKPS